MTPILARFARAAVQWANLAQHQVRSTRRAVRMFLSRLYRCATIIIVVLSGGTFLLPIASSEQTPPPAIAPISNEKEVTLDFNNVELPVFVKFVSEVTGKNFVIDERVRGTVTIFSPAKILVSRVYDLFLSVLDLKGLAVRAAGDIHQIIPIAEVPTERAIRVQKIEHVAAEEVAKVLLGLASGKTTNPTGRPVKLSGELSGSVQILSDKATNSLIITASDADYEVLKAVIRQLDTKRRQVYVEAVVLEMGVDRSKAIGADLGAVFGYRYNGKAGRAAVIGGINKNIGEFGELADLAKALGVPIDPFNVQAFLRALQTASDVNTLATPQILTTDNQKAEIVVAENVPFPGAQSQTVGGNVQTTIERKDVGITLRLTPSVLENDLVKLEVYQEASSVLEGAQTVGTTVLGPKTSKRSASTTVIVSHAQTVVIGGLIRDNIVFTERKIPLLGDMPLLGWLFKTTTRRSEKTNLLIFLTPYIVYDDDDLNEIKAEKAGAASALMQEDAIEGRERREELLDQMITLPE